MRRQKASGTRCGSGAKGLCLKVNKGRGKALGILGRIAEKWVGTEVRN